MKPDYWVPERAFMPRPVFARMIRRQNGGKVGPPTDEERQDAILLLAENYHDEVGDEAFRILDEYGR